MKTWLLAGLMFFGAGCATKERYVEAAKEASTKATMVYVKAVETTLLFDFDGKKLVISKSTAPVTYMGSGVFISPYGHILTCAHLFDGIDVSTTVLIHHSNGYAFGEVLYMDISKDLALVKIDAAGMPYAKLADPRTLAVGQEVIAVGNPVGLEWTVTKGIISALNRDMNTGYNLVQHDAANNPGNSGGPLFNLDGKLVGINNSGIMGRDGIGFSVESGQLVEFLTRFRGIDKSIGRFDLSYWQKALRNSHA